MNVAAQEIVERLDALRTTRTRVAHDIEGWPKTGVSVCSFAWSAHEALSVPLAHLDWRRWWSPDDEAAIMASIRAILEDPLVPKIMHNGSYELFLWRWHDGIAMRGIADDTMIKHCVLYPELDKALDVCASIYTKEPYWKDMGDTDDDEQLARYNALDTMVTYEINDVMEAQMTDAQRAYYTTQRDLLEPCGAMSFDGMPYDVASRDALVAKLQQDVYAAQGQLDALAGIPRPSFEQVRDAVAFKVKHKHCVDWNDLLLYAIPTMRENL